MGFTVIGSSSIKVPSAGSLILCEGKKALLITETEIINLEFIFLSVQQSMKYAN